MKSTSRYKGQSRCPGDTEPDTAELEVRRERAAVRGAAGAGVVAATAASKDKVLTGRRPLGVRYGPNRIIPIQILAPLPHVADDVIEPPGIRLLLPHRMSPTPGTGPLCLFKSRTIITAAVTDAAVPPVPGNGIQSRRVVLAEDTDGTVIKGCLRPRPASVFPLRLCGQAVRPVSLPLINLPYELLAIIPGHLLHGTIVTTIAEMGRVVPHDGVPLPLGYFRGLQIEGLRQSHLMLCLIAGPAGLA